MRTLRSPRYINSLGCLSVHSLCSFWLSPSHRPCARVSTPSLSELPFHGGFIRSLHANYCNQTYRCLLSLSPAADFAEPRPPRHTQYLDFFAPSDSRFSNSCISVKYCPFLTNIHQWKYYLISFQMIRTHMTYGFVVQGHISVRYSQVLI